MKFSAMWEKMLTYRSKSTGVALAVIGVLGVSLFLLTVSNNAPAHSINDTAKTSKISTSKHSASATPQVQTTGSKASADLQTVNSTISTAGSKAKTITPAVSGNSTSPSTLRSTSTPATLNNNIPAQGSNTAQPEQSFTVTKGDLTSITNSDGTITFTGHFSISPTPDFGTPEISICRINIVTTYCDPSTLELFNYSGNNDFTMSQTVTPVPPGSTAPMEYYDMTVLISGYNMPHGTYYMSWQSSSRI